MRNNSIISGVFWTMGERCIAQIVSFVVSIVLARLLSPTDYGVVAILLIFISIADVFVSNGFGAALIQKKDADQLDFSTLLICSVISSIVIYFIIYFLAPIIASFYNNESIVPLMRVMALRIPISGYNTIQRAYISRNMMFKKFFFSTLGGTVVSAIIGITIAYKGFGAWALVAQNLGNTIVDTIVLSITIDWKPSFRFKLERAISLMSYGWKVLCTSVIGTFFDQLQSLVIGKAFSSADLAYYNKGNQLPSLVSSNVSNSVMTVLFPAFANYSDDYDSIRNITRRAIRMMTYISFPIMIGLAMTAKPLIILLLTEKWEPSIEYMKILSISVAFGLVGDTGLQTIKAIGRSDVLLKLEFVKKPVFLILLVLGLNYGTMGVAVTTAIYSFYAMLMNFGTMGKLINYRFSEQVKDVLSVAILSLIMGVAVYICGLMTFYNYVLEIVIKACVGVAVYILISSITRSQEFIYLVSFAKKKFIK